MIVVGGKALGRKSGDTDFWVGEDIKIELHSKLDFCHMPREIMQAFSPASKESGVANESDMLAIKMSHLPWDIFWWKHAQDVLVLQNKGVVANDSLYSLLAEYWEHQHGTKTNLSLYKTKDEFFNDAVKKYFEHDYLHEIVSVNGIPVYTKCLKAGQDVLIDHNKFLNLCHTDQVRMFKEEVAVIALERWIIPALTKKGLTHEGKQFTIAQAWNKALHKTTVSLTKGWASRFITENLTEFTKPLYNEMLNSLSILNLKEKYMENKIKLEELARMIRDQVTIEDVPEWSVDWERKNNPDITDEEIIAEFFSEEGYYDLLSPRSRWVVEQEGGGEGGSEHCESVIKLGDKFYKVVYSYYSHHGYDFDYAEVFEVKPKEKTITVYE